MKHSAIIRRAFSAKTFAASAIAIAMATQVYAQEVEEIIVEEPVIEEIIIEEADDIIEEPGDMIDVDQVSLEEALDYTLEANFGDIALAEGFLPDPHEVAITSGGGIDLSVAIPDSECSGFATAAPDLELTWDQEEPGLLTVWVEAEGDTTLVINDSEGNWHCDDDSAGDLNPLVELEAAGAGVFDIWVGSYTAEEFIESTLYISEYDQTAATELDWSAEANFGSVELTAGFMPDPHEVAIVSGGDVDLALAIEDDVCAGYATANPDLKLQWTSEEPGFLKLWVESEGDTTLVINDSEGNWHCDDDSAGGVNPLVELDGMTAGQFDIWVGSYSEEDFIESTLYISEWE